MATSYHKHIVQFSYNECSNCDKKCDGDWNKHDSHINHHGWIFSTRLSPLSITEYGMHTNTTMCYICNKSYSMIRAIFILSICVLFACQGEAPKETSTKSDKTESQPTGPEITAVYTGTLPCNGCKGIQTEITLYSDDSYISATRYLGAGANNTFQHSGAVKKSPGNSLQLEKFGRESQSTTFVIEGDDLVLNSASQNISNPELLRLKKLALSMDGTLWHLVKVGQNDLTERRSTSSSFDPHIYYKPSDSRIYGNGGCNAFNGSFLLLRNNVVEMDRFAYAKMNCRHYDVEVQFFNAINNTLYYDIKGTEMSFLDQNKNFLAKFIARPSESIIYERINIIPAPDKK